MKTGDTATAQQLADLLELTPRRVQQLAKDGTFPKLDRGRYPLVECVRAYIKYWRDRAEGRFTTNELDQVKLAREQLGLRKEAVLTARAEGSVVGIDHHDEVLRKLLGAIRGVVLSIPGAWGSRVVGIPTPVEGLQTMTQLADEIVSGMASSAALFDIEEVEGPELIPDDFPGAKHLRLAGIETMEALRALDDFTLVKGIGPKTAELLEEAVAA